MNNNMAGTGQETSSDESTAGHESLPMMQPEILNSSLEYYSDIPGFKEKVKDSTSQRDNMATGVARVERYMMELVMSRNWEKLWKCLQIYYHSRVCHRHLDHKPKWNEIWQIGSEAILRLPHKNSFDRTVFFREVSTYSTYSRNHFLFEEALHLISEGEIEDALHACKEPVQLRHLISCPHEVGLEYEWNIRRTALCGLLLYLQWLKESDSEGAVMDDSSEDVFSDEDRPSRRAQLAMAAIEKLEHVMGEPGVWDVFVTKLAELYKYINFPEKAESTFHKYWQQNPNNPNAAKYLYYHLKERGAPAEEILPILKDIGSRQPSDRLVVEYVLMLRQVYPEEQMSSPPVCLHQIFSLLDYPSSSLELSPWQLLTELLKEIIKNQRMSHRKKVCHLWHSRETWWPCLYFHHVISATETNDSTELNVTRAVAATYLQGGDCDFVTKVEDWLKREGLSRLQKILHKAKKLSPVTVFVTS